ncbi:MAG: multicopper oxidase domain-containing protein [Gammaproteobacteria bacterium]
MKVLSSKSRRHAAGLVMTALSAVAISAQAEIPGLSGTSFALQAGTASIATPDGDSLQIWGYGNGGTPQYPGPTLIVEQGQEITIKLTNTVPMPVSMVFPGQTGVMASGGTCPTVSDCLITRESTGSTDVVVYTFTPTHAGTYMYHSGTSPELQTEMGLFGAIIVRPAAANQAYGHPATAYDHEYLFMLSEMDPQIHYQAEFLGLYDSAALTSIDFTDYRPQLWFLNGRNGPDTFGPNDAPWMPHQPYNSLPRTRPGEQVLMRVMGASHHLHPFHTHGNNVRIIARDGRLLTTTPFDHSESGAGPDLARSDFTIKTAPMQTYDALWDWTGKGLGWDIYGHAPGDPMQPGEYAPDHGKPIPVILPELQDLTFGGFYSGSPFLGASAGLPPGEGGLNLNGGLYFMWHSHTEKELVNNDIFPGGRMTMMVVEPPGTPIP